MAGPFDGPDEADRSGPQQEQSSGPEAIHLAQLFESAIRSGVIDPDAVNDHRDLAPLMERLQAMAGLSRDLSNLGIELGRGLPATIARYQIHEEIGRGRFGIVLRGTDPHLGREIAVKILRPEMAQVPDLRQRFLREAAAMARLNHPGVVPVYDSGEDDGLLFLVMPFVTGVTLASYQARDPQSIWPADRAAELILAVARAVDCGHQSGIVHRDLKPANVLLAGSCDPRRGPGVDPRVLDFGLARSLETDLQETRTSMILGTPLYMSLEQAESRQEAIGPPSDVFSLGAMLYELMAGIPPFAAESFPSVLERLQQADPVPLRKLNPNVPPDLETICLRCLQPLPEDRYPTAGVLAEDLRRFLAREPILARRPGPLTRLRYWINQPRRLREAGLAIVVVNILLMLYGYVGLFGLKLLGTDSRLADEEFHSQIVFMTLVATPLHFGFIAMGMLLGRGRLGRVGRLAGIATSLLWTGIANAGAVGLIYTTPWYERNPSTRLLVYLLVGGLFAVQTMAFVIGHRLTERASALADSD